MASTFAFTINSVSRISGLQNGTLRITKTFGKRGTLSCQVFSVDGSWHPLIDQEVVWTVDSVPIFGGYIRELTYLGKMLRDNDSVFYDISCGDYSSLLEDRLVTETFPAGQTLKQWLTTLVTNWLTIKGITLDAGQTDGPTMTQPLQVERMRADVVLQQILLRSEWVTRGISATKTLLLFASGTSAAPFNLTSSNRKALGDIQVSPLWNGQKYNRVILKFGVAGVVEYFYQDVITVSGTPTSVTLNYTPVGWYPVTATQAFGYGYLDSSVNGRDVVATDPSPFTQGYEYFPTTNTIQKFNGAAFANGEVLTIPYDFRYPIEVIEESGAAATNPIELLVIDESIRTKEEAELKAQRILAITSTDTERVHYFTAEDDLDIAQTQNVNIPERFFLDDCIITDLRTSDTSANPGNVNAVPFKLRHEVFATAGDQPKRTELDTVMQWSLLGSGSGSVPGTAPNSSGGLTVPPFDTYVLFNDNMTMGAASGLRYVKTGGLGSGPVTRVLDPSAPADYTSLQVIPGTDGDFELTSRGASGTQQFISEGFTIVRSNAGAVGIEGTTGTSLSPGTFGAAVNRHQDLTVFEGLAGLFAIITSLPFTINTTTPSDTNEITTFYINSASGTVNLPALSAFRSFPATSVRRILAIKNIHASGVVTVDPNSSETIDTASTLTLDPGAGIILQGQSSTNWSVLATTGGVTLGGGGGGGSSNIQTLLDGISTTHGAIIYYNGTDWVALSPGTSGNFLKTNGASADPAWASVAGSGTITVVVKSADETVTSSTTMQDDDHLSFAVDANSVYVVLLVLYVTSGASNTPDIKTGWTLPTSATVTVSQLMYDTGATTTTQVSIGHRYQNSSPSTAQPAGVLTSGTQPASSVIQHAVIRTGGTSGTAQLQWAQNTSDGTGTVVKQDSSITYIKQ